MYSHKRMHVVSCKEMPLQHTCRHAYARKCLKDAMLHARTHKHQRSQISRMHALTKDAGLRVKKTALMTGCGKIDACACT